MNVAIEQAVHGLATRMAVSALVRSLQEMLGQRLVAVIAGVSDVKAVGKWARGERTPHPEAERRLRDAFQVVQLLLRAESAETIRAWLLGMNPDLDDQSPALVLAERPNEVLQAARAFVAHG
ncbi:MAG: XRE family transcriptional regulator [Chloroflexi bacterium]|nr:XRE family transcriptional regulator [Chloroflexota bacterium]